MTSTAQKARLLEGAMADLPRFKPSDWNPYDPTAGTVRHSYTLDREIAEARREIGEARWAELQQEWRNA